MVMHLPPERRLGGARIQVELAEHLREQGHRVDLFTREDVFGTPAATTRRRIPPRFAPRAVRRIRELASDYDVVDAQQGNLPVKKHDLGFGGLLVARSVGLVPLYQENMRGERRRWPDAYHGTRRGRVLRAVGNRWDLRDALRTYAEADLINVANEDERTWLEDHSASRGKSVVLPYGLSEARLQEFSERAFEPDARLGAPEISFIGHWSLRKGAEDWPAILARIHAVKPSVRLRLLGTGGGVKGLPPMRTEIISSYPIEELPSLLAPATVGVLPSYVEGFPFAVLEQLAAGIPVVAYDTPGARETLRELDPSLLVPAGDTSRLADRVLEVLAMDVEAYAPLSAASRALAGRYAWGRIARDTADVYQERLLACSSG
jgi:glycosyltransferase involved in cell wall biosynthesis